MALHEVDLSKDEKAAKLFKYYRSQVRGLYTPTDPSRLMLSQTDADSGKYSPAFIFVPCLPSQGITECASRDEMDEYLNRVRLIVNVVENFIELDQIKPMEETLQEVVKPGTILKIDLANRGYYACIFEETRVEFSDNPLDPIGFTESGEIKYLNVQSCSKQEMGFFSNFMIVLDISNKVNI